MPNRTRLQFVDHWLALWTSHGRVIAFLVRVGPGCPYALATGIGYGTPMERIPTVYPSQLQSIAQGAFLVDSNAGIAFAAGAGGTLGWVGVGRPGSAHVVGSLRRAIEACSPENAPPPRW